MNFKQSLLAASLALAIGNVFAAGNPTVEQTPRPSSKPWKPARASRWKPCRPRMPAPC